MPRRLRRRDFLTTSAGLAAGALLADSAQGAPLAAQPAAREQRVRIGIIGTAGQGEYNTNGVAHEDIVALCDVDSQRAAPARRRFPRAAFVEDYRRLIDRKDVEAVVIATPDHHHAVAIMAALQAGKHVYCEKPLTHSVHEVRTVMATLAKNPKLATQMGTQIHAGDNYRRVVEIVQAGVLGPIRRVKVWCSRRPDAMVRAKPTDAPKHLNYDLWLGPAPQQPYPPFRVNEARGVHFDWRWWWDFGGGVLADMACHFMDLPHWALNLRQPVSVAADGRVTYKGDNHMPDLLQVDYEHPARGDLPPVHLTWYHGQPGPDLDGKIRFDGYPSGVLFEGARGSLVADYSKHKLLPEDRFKDFTPPKQTITRSIGHHREWLRAIREGTATTCNFDYSGALTETVLLGNAVYRAGGGKIQYDARTGRITAGNKKAEEYLRREYRKGWTLGA